MFNVFLSKTNNLPSNVDVYIYSFCLSTLICHAFSLVKIFLSIFLLSISIQTIEFKHGTYNLLFFTSKSNP